MLVLVTLASVFFVAICAGIAYLFYLTPGPTDNLK
jgi:hypothetical protein